MANLPKSPVPSLEGRECGVSFNEPVDVDVPYKGFGGASYRLPPITKHFIPLDDDDTDILFDEARVAHKYHHVLNDLRRSIDETTVSFSDLKKYINSANQDAIRGMIKNAKKAYENAYDIAFETEFRFPALIEFEGPGGAGGTGVPGGWSGGGSGSGSWSAGSGGAEASGGIKFGASGGVPDELIERIRDGVYPLPGQRPGDIPEGQNPGFWPVYEDDPPLLSRASSPLPDGRRAIYYGDLGWMVKIEGPMLDEKLSHKKAFASYTRALYKGIKLIRCAQEAMTAVASQRRNMKKYEMQQLQMGPGPKKVPKRLKDIIRLSKAKEYTYKEEPKPTFPTPDLTEGGFSSGQDQADDQAGEQAGEQSPTKETKNKSSSLAIVAAIGAAAIILMRKK